MKRLFSILYIVLGILLLLYIVNKVHVNDVCGTIYGCFAFWLWIYNRDRKE